MWKRCAFVCGWAVKSNVLLWARACDECERDAYATVHSGAPLLMYEHMFTCTHVPWSECVGGWGGVFTPPHLPPSLAPPGGSSDRKSVV